jgi:hypothetical protein
MAVCYMEETDIKSYKNPTTINFEKRFKDLF